MFQSAKTADPRQNLTPPAKRAASQTAPAGAQTAADEGAAINAKADAAATVNSVHCQFKNGINFIFLMVIFSFWVGIYLFVSFADFTLESRLNVSDSRFFDEFSAYISDIEFLYAALIAAYSSFAICLIWLIKKKNISARVICGSLFMLGALLTACSYLSLFIGYGNASTENLAAIFGGIQGMPGWFFSVWAGGGVFLIFSFGGIYLVIPRAVMMRIRSKRKQNKKFSALVSAGMVLFACAYGFYLINELP